MVNMLDTDINTNTQIQMDIQIPIEIQMKNTDTSTRKYFTCQPAEWWIRLTMEGRGFSPSLGLFCQNEKYQDNVSSIVDRSVLRRWQNNTRQCTVG